MIVHMIGNAHIDPVWLWRWQAGVDEALASFRSAADRCDEYPEFVYTRGEAWLFQQVERLDPALFERVRQLVAAGRWHITGGQYLQPDANLPTAMGWRRQLLHGRRYFEDRFGVIPRVGYNVDSFGHPATLPDILAAQDYIGYVFHRPGRHQVSLPAQTFRWRGSGAGDVIGFRIVPAYVTRSDDLYGQIMLAIEAADATLGHTMCFYGVGNHGGGPTKANIEYILDHRAAFPGVELRFSTPEAFFDAISPRREELPVFAEELQRTFPGCYSVMHDIKQRQVHGEHLLDQAERVIGLWSDDSARPEQHGRLDAAWNDLLFTEFHDILAGTSIPSAWESVRSMQGRAHIAGEELILETTRRWARHVLPPANHQQIVIANPDDEPWSGPIEHEPFLDFDLWGDRWLSDMAGQPIDMQHVQPESASGLMRRVVFPCQVAAQGYTQVLVRDDPPPQRPSPSSDLKVSTKRLANRHLEVAVDGRGIRSLRVYGRELLGAQGIALHLRGDATDTWTFHADQFREPVAARLSTRGWAVEERGPLRARLRLEGLLGRSQVRWTLTLHQDDPRLYIQVEVNFAEKFKLLQMPIHLAEAPERWTDGQADGAVERRPGPTEWPVQGWSRVEVAGHHIAMVTGDAYSLSLDENSWQWTLLRSPLMAWGGKLPDVYGGRDWHTDQGPHTFEFVLLAGEHLDVPMLAAAARQHVQRPIIFDRYEGMNRPPWGNRPPRQLWTEAEQRAVRDGQMRHLTGSEPE